MSDEGREAARRGVPRRPAIAFGWFQVLRGLNQKYSSEAFENERRKQQEICLPHRRIIEQIEAEVRRR